MVNRGPIDIPDIVREPSKGLGPPTGLAPRSTPGAAIPISPKWDPEEFPERKTQADVMAELMGEGFDPGPVYIDGVPIPHSGVEPSIDLRRQEQDMLAGATPTSLGMADRLLALAMGPIMPVASAAEAAMQPIGATTLSGFGTDKYQPEWMRLPWAPEQGERLAPWQEGWKEKYQEESWYTKLIYEELPFIFLPATKAVRLRMLMKADEIALGGVRRIAKDFAYKPTTYDVATRAPTGPASVFATQGQAPFIGRGVRGGTEASMTQPFLGGAPRPVREAAAGVIRGATAPLYPFELMENVGEFVIRDLFAKGLIGGTFRGTRYLSGAARDQAVNIVNTRRQSRVGEGGIPDDEADVTIAYLDDIAKSGYAADLDDINLGRPVTDEVINLERAKLEPDFDPRDPKLSTRERAYYEQQAARGDVASAQLYLERQPGVPPTTGPARRGELTNSQIRLRDQMAQEDLSTHIVYSQAEKAYIVKVYPAGMGGARPWQSKKAISWETFSTRASAEQWIDEVVEIPEVTRDVTPEITPEAALSPAAAVPTPGVGAPEPDILTRLGQAFRQGDINSAERARFLEENIRPVFRERFGDAPAMTFDRVKGENLLRISESGWENRARELGLEPVYRTQPTGQRVIEGYRIAPTEAAPPPQEVVPGRAGEIADRFNKVLGVTPYDKYGGSRRITGGTGPRAGTEVSDIGNKLKSLRKAMDEVPIEDRDNLDTNNGWSDVEEKIDELEDFDGEGLSPDDIQGEKQAIWEELVNAVEALDIEEEFTMEDVLGTELNDYVRQSMRLPDNTTPDEVVAIERITEAATAEEAFHPGFGEININWTRGKLLSGTGTTGDQVRWGLWNKDTNELVTVFPEGYRTRDGVSNWPEDSDTMYAQGRRPRYRDAGAPIAGSEFRTQQDADNYFLWRQGRDNPDSILNTHQVVEEAVEAPAERAKVVRVSGNLHDSTSLVRVYYNENRVTLWTRDLLSANPEVGYGPIMSSGEGTFRPFSVGTGHADDIFETALPSATVDLLRSNPRAGANFLSFARAIANKNLSTEAEANRLRQWFFEVLNAPGRIDEVAVPRRTEPNYPPIDQAAWERGNDLNRLIPPVGNWADGSQQLLRIYVGRGGGDPRGYPLEYLFVADMQDGLSGKVSKASALADIGDPRERVVYYIGSNKDMTPVMGKDGTRLEFTNPKQAQGYLDKMSFDEGVEHTGRGALVSKADDSLVESPSDFDARFAQKKIDEQTELLEGEPAPSRIQTNDAEADAAIAVPAGLSMPSATRRTPFESSKSVVGDVVIDDISMSQVASWGYGNKRWDVVGVAVPGEGNQAFYKSPLRNAQGRFTGRSQWLPFDGIQWVPRQRSSPTPNDAVLFALDKERFVRMDAGDPLYNYGSTEIKDMALRLDRLSNWSNLYPGFRRYRWRQQPGDVVATSTNRIPKGAPFATDDWRALNTWIDTTPSRTQNIQFQALREYEIQQILRANRNPFASGSPADPVKLPAEPGDITPSYTMNYQEVAYQWDTLHKAPERSPVRTEEEMIQASNGWRLAKDPRHGKWFVYLDEGSIIGPGFENKKAAQAYAHELMYRGQPNWTPDTPTGLTPSERVQIRTQIASLKSQLDGEYRKLKLAPLGGMGETVTARKAAQRNRVVIADKIQKLEAELGGLQQRLDEIEKPKDVSQPDKDPQGNQVLTNDVPESVIDDVQASREYVAAKNYDQEETARGGGGNDDIRNVAVDANSHGPFTKLLIALDNLNVINEDLGRRAKQNLQERLENVSEIRKSAGSEQPWLGPQMPGESAIGYNQVAKEALGVMTGGRRPRLHFEPLWEGMTQDPRTKEAIFEKTDFAGEGPVRFTSEEVEELFKMVNDVVPRSQPATYVKASSALYHLLMGEVPYTSDLRVLDSIFRRGVKGPDGTRIALLPAGSRSLIDIVEGQVKRNVTNWERAMDLLNVPRAMLTMLDYSAPLRQAILLGSGHPTQWGSSLYPGLKAAFSVKHGKLLDESIRNDPYYQVSQEFGLYIAEPSGGLNASEEAFLGNIFRNVASLRQSTNLLKKMAGYLGTVPGGILNWSERGYTTYLNKLRYDVYKQTMHNWEKAGKFALDDDGSIRFPSNVSPEEGTRELRELSMWINRATGRGGLGPMDNATMTRGLNAVFFAPRFISSRVTGPMSVIQPGVSLKWADLDIIHTPTVRSMALRSYASFVGTGATMMSLLDLGSKSGFFPGMSIESDPRSTDFGRIVWGNQRLDWWGGHQPLVRYTAQALTGQAKTGSGNMMDRNTFDTSMRLVQSKLSPVVGLGVDIGTQRTFTGDVMELTPGSIVNQIYNRATPMFTQDAIEAYKDKGLIGLTTAPGIFLGMSSVVYDGANQVGFNIIRDEMPDEWDAILNKLMEEGKAPAPKTLLDLSPAALAHLNTHPKFNAAKNEARVNAQGRTERDPLWASIGLYRTKKMEAMAIGQDVLQGTHYVEDPDGRYNLADGTKVSAKYTKYPLDQFPPGLIMDDATFYQVWNQGILKDLQATSRTIIDAKEYQERMDNDPIWQATILGEEWHNLSSKLTKVAGGEMDWNGHELRQMEIIERINQMSTEYLPYGPVVIKPDAKVLVNLREQMKDPNLYADGIRMMEWVTGREIGPTGYPWEPTNVLGVEVRVPTALITPDLTSMGQRFPKNSEGQSQFPELQNKAMQASMAELAAREMSWRIPNQMLLVLPGNANDSSSESIRGLYQYYLNSNEIQQRDLASMSSVISQINKHVSNVRAITKGMEVPFFKTDGAITKIRYDAVNILWGLGMTTAVTQAGQGAILQRLFGQGVSNLPPLAPFVDVQETPMPVQ